MTYSFPCQDLSLAGNRKGMSDTSTRSGMLWEVERILSESKNKPQVLLMENVIQVHSQENLQDFNRWQLRLEELGYKNYWQDLIATDYGIPQTRNRTFMVSILGDYSYTFPQPIPLKLKLKDMLEENVDKKYFLSERLIKTLNSDKNINGYVRGKQFRNNINRITAITLTAAPQERTNANYIGDLEKLRIRKLIPIERFRLMGVRDEDINNVLKNQSDSSAYHLAGDSIVVNVLMAIFKEMI